MDAVQVDRPREGVVLLTLSRPERLNALNEEVFRSLETLLPELEADPTARVIVLTGSGRGFCAGHDLTELPSLMERPFSERLGQIDYEVATLIRFRTMATPVIAAVNGPAHGGGMSIAAACDMRIASDRATFGVAFINIGISSGDAGLSWTLPRIVGTGHAAELMMTGRVIDAAEALRIGFVNRVVPHEQLVDEAIAWAETVAAHNRFALQLTKRTINASASSSLADAIALENTMQLLAMDAPQARDHNQKFLGKTSDGSRS